MRAEEIKKALNKRVKLTDERLYIKSSWYILAGAIFRKSEETGQFYYQLELKDIKTNSVIICNLNVVEFKEDL